jgi:hypothetical protein
VVVIPMLPSRCSYFCTLLNVLVVAATVETGSRSSSSSMIMFCCHLSSQLSVSVEPGFQSDPSGDDLTEVATLRLHSLPKLPIL